MKWSVEEAKNGESTLLLNGIQIYSKYRPIEDAHKFIRAEYDSSAENYVLIGLGLGYHLKSLLNFVSEKKIIVYYFSEIEMQIFKKHNPDNWWKKLNVQIVKKINYIDISSNSQVILPNVWLKAIGQNHPLFSILEVIKINQISYKIFAHLLKDNFCKNKALNDDTIQSKVQKKVACLVAAGPSLNETVHWLKKKQQHVDIYVVGAALKTLLAHSIKPKATVLSDAGELTMQQFENTNFQGELYYLSTANHQSVLMHNGPRFILYQRGYRLAEKEANGKLIIETGGSVGTTTFNLLEQLGYKKIILFGQDLGFNDQYTHAEYSTSNKQVTSNEFLRTIQANDGSTIYTSPSLQTFKFWYDQKMQSTKVKVFNTASKGAKIANVPFINEQQFQRIINDVTL